MQYDAQLEFNLFCSYECSNHCDKLARPTPVFTCAVKTHFDQTAALIHARHQDLGRLIQTLENEV